MTLRRWVVVRCRTAHAIWHGPGEEVGVVARCFTRFGAGRLARALMRDEQFWTTGYRARRRKAGE